MTYEEAEAYIHSFTRFGSQLSLNRMRSLMELLGNPQERLRFVHIAGTNGKGSTAQMTAEVLQQAGYRTGMYTSPFVVEFRERFQINGEMISKEEFVHLVEEIDPFVHQLADSGNQVTEFEMITAIAFVWFARMACDIVALEVGLGGRFDATNIIPTPECAIIVSISLDHMDILGDTIEKIASEKAGIIKENTDVVTYACQEPDALAVFYETCAKTGSRLVQPNPNAVQVLECGISGSRFRYSQQEYRLRLVGRHQIWNALGVIETVDILRKKGYSISQEALVKGIEKAVVPARFELLSTKPLIILDGAHNLQAAQSLSDTLSRLTATPKIAIMGMMRDKDYPHALKCIGEQCQAILTVPVPAIPRALSAEELAQAASGCCEQVEAFQENTGALARALALAGEEGAVILCGSFYLAADMRNTVREYLRFR